MENEKRLIIDALKKYHDAKFTPGVYEHSIFGKAALLLEKDSVEVVRCKDCKYARKEIALDNKEYFMCKHTEAMQSGNHFCSYGERRPDNA